MHLRLTCLPGPPHSQLAWLATGLYLTAASTDPKKGASAPIQAWILAGSFCCHQCNVTLSQERVLTTQRHRPATQDMSHSSPPYAEVLPLRPANITQNADLPHCKNNIAHNTNDTAPTHMNMTHELTTQTRERITREQVTYVYTLFFKHCTPTPHSAAPVAYS